VSPTGVESVQPVSIAAGTRFVPPLEGYEVRSESWVEAEYHCFRDPTGTVLCAAWQGEPGTVYLGPWPYDEVCVLLSGAVAIVDEAGSRREFEAPEAFVIPRTFSGSWETMEPTRKIFVAIATPST
jgi:uncharacterized cupin superfamily protein